MALAPLIYTIWNRVLRFDPQDPIWPNRDRFVLSMGHASMLLYSLLHLTGVKAVSKDYERLGEPSVPLDEPLPIGEAGLRHLAHEPNVPGERGAFGHFDRGGRLALLASG